MKTRFFALLVFILSMGISSTAQQTLYKSMQHDGVTRDYIVYVPEMYDGSSEVPLMFNFHGYTMSAEDQMNFCDMRSIADTAGFILVYPEGTLFWGATHWNVGSWTSTSTADDIGFTEAMIDTLAANYNVDLERVYSSGFSNGGYFSFVLACELSDKIAAIGTVGGTMSTETFNDCDPLRPMPVLTIHGTVDGTVSYNGGVPFNSKSMDEVTEYWTTFNETDSQPIESNLPDLDSNDGSTVQVFDYKNGEACTSVQHYRVTGGDHDWPGMWGNMDMDASNVIWNFVSKYDMDGLVGCSISSTVQNKLNNIEVYPNPTNGIITIIQERKEPLEFAIYSTIGAQVVKGIMEANSKSIDIADLKAGVYYLKLADRVIKISKLD